MECALAHLLVAGQRLTRRLSAGFHDGVHDVYAGHLRAEHHIAHDRLHLHVRFHHGVLVRFLARAQSASRAPALAHTA